MKDADHDVVWVLVSLEARSASIEERNGQLFVEMSLMADHLY